MKGYADEGLVRDGRVCELDRIGDNLADEAADFGRRRVDAGVTDVRRIYACACRTWYPVVRDLHHFFVEISRAIVNDDSEGGAALNNQRRVVEAVRDFAVLPGTSVLVGWLAKLAQSTGGQVVQFRCQLHPLCPGADVWKMCQYLEGCCASFDGCLVVWGGTSRAKANHGRPRQLGFEKSSRGLACTPRESSGEGFFFF